MKLQLSLKLSLASTKALRLKKVDATVPADGVENELKRVQEQNSRLIAVEDRAAQMGDIVNISYEGTVDGVALTAARATTTTLHLVHTHL